MGTLTCVVAPGTTGSRDLWLLRASITCALAPGPPCAPAQVRAGAGGAEAALFAAQLLDFYERAATSKGWEFEVRHLGLQCPPLRVCVCARARMGMRPCTCACKCMRSSSNIVSIRLSKCCACVGVQLLEVSPSDLGGVRTASAVVSGLGVYGRMR